MLGLPKLLLPGVLLVISPLLTRSQEASGEVYRQQLEKWHLEREDELKKENGWLSLAGLFWLKEGSNTFGSADNNGIVFPAGFPLKQGGDYILQNGKITFHLNSRDIKVTGFTGTDSILNIGDNDRRPVQFILNGFKWIIIKRQDKYGVRIWDNNSVAVKQFRGVPRFPVDTAWKIKARFLPAADNDEAIFFKNKIGQSFENKAVGKIAFQLNGQSYTLDILSQSGEGYFIVFGDKTTGEQTYASGRFLTVAKADNAGNTYIDFNRAINPPCAFTDYATCPLPPASNVLAVAVPAGEKDFHLHP